MTDDYHDYLNYLDFEPQFILEAGVGQLQQCRTSGFWNKNVKCCLFEPHPKQFREIREAAAPYPNVEVRPYALWDYDGTVKLYRYDAASWVDGVVPPRVDLLGRKSSRKRAVTVSCTPLSSFDDGLYDLALIDVESSELKVLRHMVSRPRLIVLELSHPRKPDYKHPDGEEIRRWLEDNEYKEVGTHENDYYFIRRRIVPRCVFRFSQRSTPIFQAPTIRTEPRTWHVAVRS